MSETKWSTNTIKSKQKLDCKTRAEQNALVFGAGIGYRFNDTFRTDYIGAGASWGELNASGGPAATRLDDNGFAYSLMAGLSLSRITQR